MPQYRYQARNGNGAVEDGALAAVDAATAAAMLRGKGLHVMQLAPSITGPNLKNLSSALNWSSGPSKKDILDFTTQLAVMIRAGISIRQALDGIAEQTSNARFKAVLQEIKADIESGKQFSEAIARHPKLFGPLYISMVRASEMSGRSCGAPQC